jgi:lauroyl/myristoyl acyltransferase
MIAAIPRSLLPGAASLISAIAILFARRDARIISGNVLRVYNLPLASEFSLSFVRQVFHAQACLLLETIRYVYRPAEVVIEGFDEAQKILQGAAEQSGVVIIAAHHGAWELAGHFAAKSFKQDFYALAKPSQSGWLTKALNDMREKLGMKVLWTDSKTLLRDMMSIANKKEHLGFVMDQRPAHRSSGLPCDFLGVSGTHIVSGPVMMATKKRMPVFGVHVVRVGFCHYKFFVTEVLKPGHSESDENKVAQLMADDLSKMILSYPEQWAWNYRRWK